MTPAAELDFAMSALPSANGMNLAPRPRWYALRVKPRHEKSVADALGTKGFEAFLPLYIERRRWSDRIKEVETPLFANYTFGRFDAGDRLPVLRIPGVNGVVKFGNTLAEVDASEIDAIRAAAGSGRTVRPCEFLSAGRWVRIVSGPLADVEGIFERFSGAEQLVVSVTILQRSVSVKLAGDSVMPIPGRGRPSGFATASSAGRHAGLR